MKTSVERGGDPDRAPDRTPDRTPCRPWMDGRPGRFRSARRVTPQAARSSGVSHLGPRGTAACADPALDGQAA